ncbi:oligosaccharide flippase family protein [Vibrio vulnificus]|nr:oligosaccharide flippase family protein [Vibrio vulnificus]EIZ1360374.1 oligosaccharide flippase family protein [Vibrio vulnificus]
MFKNISWLTIANVLSAVSSFIYIPFLIEAFGLEIYGQIVIVQTVVAIAIALSNLNTWQGIIQYCIDGVNKSLYFKLILRDFSYSIIVTVVTVVLYILLYDKFSGIDQNKYILLFLIFSVPFVPCNISIAVFRINEIYVNQAIIEIAQYILRLVLVLYFSHVESLTGYVLSVVILDIVKWIGLNILASSFLIEGNENVDLNKIYKFSFWAWLSQIIQLPSSQFDKVFVSATLGAEITGVYNVLKRISMAILFVTNPIYQILYPTYKRLVNTSHVNEIRKVYFKFTAVILVVLIFWFGGTNLLYEYWITVFLSNNVLLALPIDTRDIYIAMSVGYFIILTFVPIHPLFTAMGYAKGTTIFNFMGSVVNLAVVYLLIDYLGVYSIIIGFLLSDIIIISSKIFIISNRYWKV